MPECIFQVDRSRPDELTLRLGGVLDEDTALGCEREARAQLGLAKNGSQCILWDLREVTGYSLPARAVLVRLQSFLADKAQKTVYVATRPEARSLALWAVHMAGSLDACIATDLEGAMAYLRGRGEPETGVRPLASTRPAPISNLDKAAS